MKKTISVSLKNGIKIICFFAGLLIILLLLKSILIFKQEDGTNPVRNYYDLPENTVDVLVLGTSHAGMNVSSKTLWNEYGIASYRFWGSVQPIWSTYYYLCDALKYQNPKVIVMDAHSLTFNQEYSGYAVQVKNTIGMNLSKEKIDNILVSAPKEEQMNFVLGFPTYHNRYSELTEADFQYMPWDKHIEIQVLSSELSEAVYSFDILNKSASSGEAELGEKEELYFRKILALCQQKEIPLELVVCPYEISEHEQQLYRRAASIAKEYGFQLTNFNENYREYGIDPHTDYLDPGHFNKFGLPKYARALYDAVLSKYEIADRRNDPNHIWNKINEKQAEPVYEMTEQFHGDGKQDYYDTGLKLYENALSSWTLCTEFDLPDVGMIMSCCKETPRSLQGLYVRTDEKGILEIGFGVDFATRITNPDDHIKMIISKKGQQFEIYINGELVEDKKLDNTALAQYDGTLLLGCQLNAEGRKVQFSDARIYDLVVYDTVLSNNDIKNWKRAELPYVAPQKHITSAENILASLEHKYVGNGNDYINTGLKLYEDPESSWTILSLIEPAIGSGDSVYYSCFSEVPEHYRGILVRHIQGNQIEIVYGNASGLDVEIPEDKASKLVIVKDRSAYTIYVNDKKVLDEEISICDEYDGPLMIGCELDENDEVFRRSATTIDNLEIYDGVMTEEEIKNWSPAVLEEYDNDPGMSVEYTMSESFSGNGKNAYIDTGIKLFDNSTKNWSIEFALDQVDQNKIGGTIVSCYNEKPNEYRGLLVRQIDEVTFGVVTGTEYSLINISPAEHLYMTIVKEGDQYSIYSDGKLVSKKESKNSDYQGNLFIGCERNVNGRPFRFSEARIRMLKVTDSVLSKKEIEEKYSECRRTYWKS